MTKPSAVPTYGELLSMATRGRHSGPRSRLPTGALAGLLPEAPPLPNPYPAPSQGDGIYGRADPDQAEEFLRLYYSENPDAGQLEPRLSQVKAMIASVGTYRHTPGELAFGARVAWRNSSRCIGRLYWNSLRVLDRRTARTPELIYHHLVTHLRETTNGGRIRPTISIFAPAAPHQPYTRIWNDQLIRYAGYRRSTGQVIGDPRYVEFTKAVQQLGWLSKGSAFDILPLAIEVPGEQPRLFDLPEDAILEVPLHHPDHRWFIELGLRWHAVPAISNMRLEIGGIHYPFAPFNGWYLGTEIGARNLADADRYNLLPVIAHKLGLDTSSDATLWRDRALVELNVAVLYSFNSAGVKIADHHTESRRFLTHIEREERAGRIVPADWSWIVPPISGGITPVFHRYYDEADLRPNFYLDDDAARIATHGNLAACPHGHGHG
ncbi:MAG: nitric oxide synthase oxygenase [Actinomycetia bacterium]|nr:nitric oxide synthase oxygenase [Actinomycetes bacterium]